MCFREKMFSLSKSINRFKRKILFDIFRFYSRNCNSKFSHKSHSPPWKIVFYGTDSLSEVTLKALNNNRIQENGCRVVKNLEVVCVKSDSAVRRYATSNNLTIHTWPVDIPDGLYDVGVVVSFGHMIPSSSISACTYGIINAHPSLLPRWRGAAPIIHTILNGEEETGVTITQVSPNKFDVGNILMQEQYIVPERYTAKLLTNDLAKLAADMILKTLQKLPYYVECSYPQPSVGRTLAHKIQAENCAINWSKESSDYIDRKFRAFDGFFNVYTTWKGHLKLDILDIVPPQEIKDANISYLVNRSMSPGECYFHKKRKVLFIKCQDGWIGVKSVRIPKRGKISALDFYNGFVTKEKAENCYFV